MSTVLAPPAAAIGTPVTPRSPAPPIVAVAAPRRFRPDIEGLRAVAVLLVVLYHARLGPFTGGFVGVDVFFVISGFLITGQLTETIAGRGMRGLPHFYARRIRRLLPASTLVTLATLAAAWAWAPALSLEATSTDAVFTSFFALNYHLVASGSQYFHAGDLPSLLQHHWSLAVEEQFYVAWPLVVAMAFLVGRRRWRGLLTVVLVQVVAASFAWSLTTTSTEPNLAYLSLHTRAWELGAGALLALAVPRLRRIPRLLATPLSWASLGSIVGAAVWFDTDTPFPGTAALVPVLATAALLAVGTAHEGLAAERALSEPVLQGLGRISYPLYLWHWPLLLLVPYALGRPLAWDERAEVAMGAVLLAALTHAVVDGRSRRSHRSTAGWFRVGILLAACTAAGGVILSLNLPEVRGSGRPARAVSFDAAVDPDQAAVRHAIETGLATRAVPTNLRPTLSEAARDEPLRAHGDCLADFATVDQGPCTLGDPAGTRTVVLVGDSHADQWLPALDAAARARGWRLVHWTKAACPVADVSVFAVQLDRSYRECDTWRRRLRDRIRELRPHLVVASQSNDVPGDAIADRDWADATLRGVRHLEAAAGAPVALVEDIPVPGRDIPACLAEHLDDARDCTTARSAAYRYGARHAAVAERVRRAGVPTVDPAPWLCAHDACPAIVGDVLVYRDDSHLTATFARLLEPLMGRLLADASG